MSSGFKGSKGMEDLTIGESNREVFFRLLKKAQMQGSRDASHLPLRQAILRNETYLHVRRNDEG